MKLGTTIFFFIEIFVFNKGILVYLGSFHLYFEFLAAMLTMDAFFKFYIPFFNALRDKDVNIFKNSFWKDFLPLVLRIFLILVVAAVLEIFWSSWWVYIFTNHYISWYEFYLGAYSIILK